MNSTSRLVIDSPTVTCVGSCNFNVGVAFLFGAGSTGRVDAASLILSNAVVTCVGNYTVGLAVIGGTDTFAEINAVNELHNANVTAREGIVGVLQPGSTVNPQSMAMGRLDMVDSSLTFSDKLDVAILATTNVGIGAASGVVSLVRSTLVVSNELTVGDDGLLAFEVGGINRGTDYGAMDVGTAMIDGAIHVDFSYMPSPGEFFDLIVTDSPTGMVNGISSLTFSGGAVTNLIAGVGLDAGSNQVFRVGLIPPPHIQDASVSNGTACLTLSNLVAGNSYRIESALDVTSNQWEQAAAFIAPGKSHTWCNAETETNQQYRLSSP